jgi:ribonucleoside-diphosphate reductase alpha subunit
MNLEVYKTKAIKVTDNHRFWSISNDDKVPKWREVKDITSKHKIAIPSYNGTLHTEVIDIEELLKTGVLQSKYKLDGEHVIPYSTKVYNHLNYGDDITINSYGSRVKKQVIIDADLANVMGMFIGDGHIIINKGVIRGIGFTVHNKNTTEIDFISNTVENAFGLKPSFHKMKTQNVTQVLFNSYIIGMLFMYMFGKGFNGKKMWKNMVHWDIALVKNFLAGLITTDGCISKEGQISVQLSNKNLINELYHLFRMFGIDVSINEVKKPPKMATVIPWCLSIPKDKYILDRTKKLYSDSRVSNCINKISDKCSNQSMPTVIDEVKFLRVKRVSETDLAPEYVYTIGVDEDHSYNVEGLICENCFLLGTNDDLTDIATTWNSCAQISKWAGGIGLHVSNIRGKDSLIKGTGGRSNGLVPFLRVFNDIARWIDQGGKRPGSIAIYLEPHHPDIFEFLELRKNFGSETERARDLFLALWVSDLFMKQVEVDGDWYLLSPDNCPGLTDAFGSNYEILYWQYVNEGKFKSKVKARKLWLAILDSQIETGMPYISYKDAVNKKSNQKNIGTIKSSNLCNEIVQYSDHKEYAVCNLASIALKSFIIPFDFEMTREWIVYSKPNCKYCRYAKSYLDSNNVHFTEVEFSNDSLLKLKEILHTQKVTFPQIFTRKDTEELVHIGGWSDLYKHTGGQFNYQKLYDIAYLATVNLNQVIDVNYYPVPETRFSNMRHRPIGLGIQGLADSLALMRIPFDSDDAVQFNSKMMETIYLASVTASNDLAIGRMEGMGRLIEWFRVSMKQYPEFYDESFVLDSVDMSELYHSLKPCKYELDRDPNLTTIGSYSTFDGSPFSEGKFQFDLWEKPEEELMYPDDWRKLREKVIIFGTRNSLLTALMPTASTSQILGNNECFEFFTNNIYTRKTQAGDFILVNKYLVKDLISIGLWSDNMKNLIIANDGSIQAIEDIPPEIRTIYKTMWELKQLWVMKGAVARGPFVDQTQSMNIFMGEPDYQRLTSSHFYGWKNGLKTGMYYLRSKPSANATKFTIDPNLIKNKEQCGSNETKQEEVEACLSCSG